MKNKLMKRICMLLIVLSVISLNEILESTKNTTIENNSKISIHDKKYLDSNIERTKKLLINKTKDEKIEVILDLLNEDSKEKKLSKFSIERNLQLSNKLFLPILKDNEITISELTSKSSINITDSEKIQTLVFYLSSLICIFLLLKLILNLRSTDNKQILNSLILFLYCLAFFEILIFELRIYLKYIF